MGKKFIAVLPRLAKENKYLFVIPVVLGYGEICSKFPHAKVIKEQPRTGRQLIERGRQHLTELGGISWDTNIRTVMEAIR